MTIVSPLQSFGACLAISVGIAAAQFVTVTPSRADGTTKTIEAPVRASTKPKLAVPNQLRFERLHLKTQANTKVFLKVLPSSEHWTTQGGAIVGGPSIVALGADRSSLALFARGKNNHLFWRRIGLPGLPWTDLGGDIRSAPSCVSRYDSADLVECYATGSSGKLWQIKLTNGNPGAWKNLGILMQGQPVAIDINRGLAVAAVQPDRTLLIVEAKKPVIKGAGYIWEAPETVRTAGSHTFDHVGNCYRWVYDNFYLTCGFPVGAGIATVYPFRSAISHTISSSSSSRGSDSNLSSSSSNTIGWPDNYGGDSPLDTDYAPAFLLSDHVLAFTKHGSQSLGVIVGFEPLGGKYSITDLGGRATSGPSCVARRKYEATPNDNYKVSGPDRYACAVRGIYGRAWVREFEVTE